MAQVRDELLGREITREELKALVDEWVAKGGKIKQCPPAKAYSYNIGENIGSRPQVKTPTTKKSKSKKAKRAQRVGKK